MAADARGDRFGDDVDRLDLLGDRRRRLDRLRLRSTPARRARRSARRSSWPPTASRTTTTRSLEGQRLERVQLIRRAAARRHRHRPAAVLGARADPPGRRHGGHRRSGSPAGARALFAPTGRRRLQLRRLPRRHERHRRRRRRTRSPTRSPARCAPSTGYAPALNTVLYRFDEAEVRYILTYGRPGSPMSAWGLAGGGPMNAQQIADAHRLHQVDPDPPRGLLAGGGGRPALPESATCRPTIQADIETARPPVRRGRHVRDATARRCSTSTCRSGAYSCARCHTKGWSYGDPGVPGQGAFGWNLTGGNTDRQVPERGGHDRVRRRPARSTAPATPRSRRAAAGCPASARCSPTSSCTPSSSTCGACDDWPRPCSPSLGARAPRHPHRHHRRRWCCAAAST